MNNTTNNARQVGITIAIVLVIVIALFTLPSLLAKKDATQAGPNPLDSFAMCVADTGLTMYGAEWCSYCKKEKEAFGSAWQYIPYVECPENAKMCLDKGVQGYPTWIAQDGTLYQGLQGLSKIAEITGCELPE